MWPRCAVGSALPGALIAAPKMLVGVRSGSAYQVSRVENRKTRLTHMVNGGHSEMTWRLRVYEFLATPAHAWLWLCARFVGMRFECGPVADPNDSLE